MKSSSTKKQPYRPDGWPLCPKCHLDELASLANWYCPHTDIEPPPWSWWFSKGFSCYACGFVGMIPARGGDGQ